MRQGPGQLIFGDADGLFQAVQGVFRKDPWAWDLIITARIAREPGREYRQQPLAQIAGQGRLS